MRLSDKQYRNYTRVGFVITIVAALVFDRVGTGIQPVVLAVAVVGALIGFFPLITSRAFEAHDPEGAAAERVLAENARYQVDLDSVPNEQTKLSEASAHAGLSNRGLETYLRSLYSAIDSNVGGGEGVVGIYRFSQANSNLGRYFSSTFEFERERERAERVHEMHEIVHRLRGTPQAFSVELTSSNSIIVRCERMKESELLDEVVENWDRQLQSASTAQTESIN